MPFLLAAWEFLSGGLVKLATALFDFLKTIPWYVLVIAGLVVLAFFEWHLIKLANDRTDREAAKVDRANAITALWQKADGVDHASVLLLLGAVQANNRTITGFRAEADRAEAAGRIADAKALKAQATADSARAILAHAKPITDDVAAPPEHVDIEDGL